MYIHSYLWEMRSFSLFVFHNMVSRAFSLISMVEVGTKVSYNPFPHLLRRSSSIFCWKFRVSSLIHRDFLLCLWISLLWHIAASFSSFLLHCLLRILSCLVKINLTLNLFSTFFLVKDRIQFLLLLIWMVLTTSHGVVPWFEFLARRTNWSSLMDPWKFQMKMIWITMPGNVAII